MCLASDSVNVLNFVNYLSAVLLRCVLAPHRESGCAVLTWSSLSPTLSQLVSQMSLPMLFMLFSLQSRAQSFDFTLLGTNCGAFLCLVKS